jgi:hypothetical protein
MAGKAGRIAESDALALLRDERDRAVETLRRIEDEGWTYQSSQGPDAPLRDITAKSANRQRQIIERMDRLIGYFEDAAIPVALN